MPTIRKRGDRYQVQVRIKINGELAASDSATFATERQAKAWGYAREAQLTADLAKPKAPDGTVAALLYAYKDYRTGIRPMARGMQHSLKELLQSPFAEKLLVNLTAKDLTDWGTKKATDISAVTGKRLSPSTVMHHFMVLRSAMQMSLSLIGQDMDLKPVVHAMQTLQRVKLLAKSQSRDRRVTDDEIGSIIKVLRGKFLMIPTDTFIQLAVVLPRRREELLTMQWEDYTGSTVLLRDTKNPKAPRDELIPVPPAARAIIDNLPKFPGEPRILPYKPESVSAAFQRAVREAGLEDLRLHDLRHEGISRLFEQGLQIQEVAMISGHLSWATLRRYTHIKPHDVVEKLNVGFTKAQKDTAQPA